MSEKVSSLLQAASTLTPLELEDFHQRLLALRLLTGDPESEQSGKILNKDSGDWAERALYEAVTERLLQLFRRVPASWTSFRHSTHYRKFRGTVEKVLAQHEQLCPGQIRLEKISMLMLYGRLAAEFVAEGRAAGHFKHAVFRDALGALDDLAMLVDHYFPSYAASGLLAKVAMLRTSPRTTV